jgi:hypothetical protein
MMDNSGESIKRRRAIAAFPILSRHYFHFISAKKSRQDFESLHGKGAAVATALTEINCSVCGLSNPIGIYRSGGK